MKALIESGKAVLGIEFGSTRIKAILIDEKNQVIASGDHEWENQLENKIWTYFLEALVSLTDTRQIRILCQSTLYPCLCYFLIHLVGPRSICWIMKILLY